MCVCVNIVEVSLLWFVSNESNMCVSEPCLVPTFWYKYLNSEFTVVTVIKFSSVSFIAMYGRKCVSGTVTLHVI